MRRPRLFLSLLALGVRSRPARPRRRAPTPASPTKTILLGGTAPLSGPASAYASVARGADAYFKYVERARRGERPQDRLQVPRRRLQPGADGAGDAPARRAGQGLRDLQLARHRAERGDPAVPEPARVPQLFVASGATTFGRDYKQYPWTIGFQPSYRAEGWIYGKYLARTKPRAQSRSSSRTTTTART